MKSQERKLQTNTNYKISKLNKLFDARSDFGGFIYVTSLKYTKVIILLKITKNKHSHLLCANNKNIAFCTDTK